MKRRSAFLLSALAVALVAGGYGAKQFMAKRNAATAAAQASANAPTTVDVVASDMLTLQPVALGQGVPVSGSLRAVNSVWVKARVPGELQGLTVREGDRVQAGQVLGQIETTELRARVRQAQQQTDAAKAQVDIAQRQYDNNKALVAQGFISQTALDTSLASLNAAKATQQAAASNTDVVRKSLTDAVLRAPFSGLVSQRSAQPGEHVGVDTRVVEIVDPSRMELEASLSPADSVQVRVGQSARLRIEGLPQDLAAQVTRISPSTQAGTRQVLAYLAVQSHPGLRQGLFAQGTLGTAQVQALAVPLSAVRTDQPQPYLQTVQNGQIVMAPITLGQRGQVAGSDEPYVQVDGLAAGTVVLRAQVGSLRAGTRVRTTVTAPAAPASAPTAKAG